jgi:ParB-like chromosome segregation protein Spo0J
MQIMPTDNTTDTVPPTEATDNTGTETGTSSSPFRWRDVLPIHPAADDYPLMSETDPASLKELAEDIMANGLIDPIVLWTKDSKLLLDGRNRLDAMEHAGLLGVDDRGDLRDLRSGNEIKLQFYTEGDPYALALSLNVHRRHLTSAQKRDLIAKVLAADPQKSNRQIASIVKVDHKTVADVRSGKEGRGEIPHVPKRIDSKGREQPAQREISAAEREERDRKRMEREQKRLEHYPDVIQGMCERVGFVSLPTDDKPGFEIPPGLTAETAAELIPGIDEAIENLKRLKAALAEIAGGGGEARRVH